MLITYDNKCYNYIYSVFIHIFIGFWNIFFYSLLLLLLALVYWIYLICIYCISTVFIEIVFIHILFIFVGLDLNSPLFSTCIIIFIQDKSYFEGRACYIGKIKPTCIE